MNSTLGKTRRLVCCNRSPLTLRGACGLATVGDGWIEPIADQRRVAAGALDWLGRPSSTAGMTWWSGALLMRFSEWRLADRFWKTTIDVPDRPVKSR